MVPNYLPTGMILQVPVMKFKMALYMDFSALQKKLYF